MISNANLQVKRSGLSKSFSSKRARKRKPTSTTPPIDLKKGFHIAFSLVKNGALQKKDRLWPYVVVHPDSSADIGLMVYHSDMRLCAMVQYRLELHEKIEQPTTLTSHTDMFKKLLRTTIMQVDPLVFQEQTGWKAASLSLWPDGKDTTCYKCVEELYKRERRPTCYKSLCDMVPFQAENPISNLEWFMGALHHEDAIFE